MSTHKHIDRICCAALVIVLLLTLVLINAKMFGVQPVSAEIGYEARLFDTSWVHEIDIEMEDWDEFLETCENEEYKECMVTIDGEAYTNVGIRAKGNTSLSLVSGYGNDRYSFKLEFDCYDDTKSYYGLDKISLNNIIQDNTYMKDYLCYEMMRAAGVASPLCSYVYIIVNGEEWGLYLAVEAVEESFLRRNYGNDYGELYKPDSTDMGGEMLENREMPGNGKGPEGETPENGKMPGNGEGPEQGRMPGNGETPEQGKIQKKGGTPGGSPGENGMAAKDVSLIYTDDSYESYSNIFDNAKTDITDEDRDRLIAALKKLNENCDLDETVEVEQVIRYFVVHNFVCSFDSYTGSIIHNYYLYEKEGQMSMIPWDYNLAFGGFEAGTDARGLINYPIDTPVSGGELSSRPMLAWIFENEEYTQIYHTYFAEFMEEYFESGYFEKIFASTVQMIAPYVKKDVTKFCTFEEFEAGTETLKEFCTLRAESVSAQLEGIIPSTADGQKAEGVTFIDSEGLSLSSMGTMR